ncbi:hypothetical protein HDU98_009430 [Podochytrium sp. JEL0797]|nr:hypothetical protein HDU98_009430 [Podochytrium sp. JEL0797]
MRGGAEEGPSGIHMEQLHQTVSEEKLIGKAEEEMDEQQHPTASEEEQPSSKREEIELDEDEDYIDEIYDVLDAVCPRTDNPSLRSLTFRVWFLGILFGSLLCVANTIFTFRSNSFNITPIIAAILAYPCGKAMAAYLPSGWMNPGKFNHKEHCLIFILASGMGSTPYALKNIVIQKYMLHQTNLTLLSCLIFAISTQCFGYCFAGLCRRFLVRPAAMLWPQNLATVAMLNTMHREDDAVLNRYPMSRATFFWLVTAAMAFWELLPAYAAPLLSSISVLCFVADRNKIGSPQILKALGSAQSGVGFLSFTLDWSLITNYGPITSPLWATLNQFLGLYLCLWVMVPLLWHSNAFGMDQTLGTAPWQGPNGTNTSFPLGFALNSPYIFDRNGTMVDVLDAYTWTSVTNSSNILLNFDKTWMEEHGPLNITTYFAFEYMTAFMVFAASLMHVGLWYGPELWFRLRSKLEDLDTDDIHTVLMDVYEPVPEAWYLSLLTWTGVWTIFVCQTEFAFSLPWYGVLLAIGTALFSIVPFGIIQAISGQTVQLKAVSELLSGYLFPGDILAVMTFKTLSSVAMAQGLTLVSDMKLGHYMKIPPRSLFLAQFVGSVLGAVISTGIATILCDQLNGNSGASTSGILSSGVDTVVHSTWTGIQYKAFLSEGILFGAIGPSEFLGFGTHYFKILGGFVIGFLLPILPWALHLRFPASYWHLLNFPLIFVFPSQVGGMRSDMITPLVIAIIVNYYVRVYRNMWWKKYAYVMSAAFDSGTSITLLLLFFVNTLNTAYKMPFPPHPLNFADIEGCAPDFFLTCVAHETMGNGFGGTYLKANDSACVNFGTSS